MYLEHYRLEIRPFEIDPDPKFFWLGETHREVFNALREVILEDEGVVCLTGGPGTGKSIFLSGVARVLGHPFQCVQISDSGMNGMNVLRQVVDALGIGNSFNRGADVFGCLKRFASETTEDGKKVVLLIDDAHRLSLKPLRQLRLLANIQQEGRPLIHIVFAGQDACERLLPPLRAVSQPIVMSYTLQPLTKAETADYILHRLHVAGANTEIFTSGAMAEIFHLSDGIPRLINIICESALLRGHARNAPIIGPRIILESQGPGHRLIHEICKLDKELSAQHPGQLPTRRTGAVFAIGAPAVPKNRPPATGPGRWQGLLKMLGLKPLTVKAAMVAPISLITVLGLFGHFYFSNEDEDPPFKPIPIHSERVTGRQGILQPENSFTVPSGSDRVASVAEVHTHDVRPERQAGPLVPSNDDRGSALEIDRLRGELRFLLQQLRTAFDATAQLEQRLLALEQELRAEKNSTGRLIAEVLTRESEIQEWRQALESFKRQQLALEAEVEKVRNNHAQLQTQLADLSAQKTRAASSADALRTPLKPKRTVVRPEGKSPLPPAPTGATGLPLKENGR